MPDASFSTATSTGTPRPSTYSRRTRWPGPFGRDHDTSTPVGRRDVAEADVEAVAEDQRVARREVGLDRLGVELPLHVVGREDHDDVGLLAPPRPASARAGPRPRPWRGSSSPRAGRRGRRRRSRAGTARGRGPGCRSRAPPRSCPGSRTGRRRRRRTSRPRWALLRWLSVAVSDRDRGRRRSVRRSGRTGRTARRRVRSVIERGPRPIATMPDWTSSRMPNGSSTRSSAASLSALPVTSMVTASGATSTTLARNSWTASRTWPRVSASAVTLTSSSSRWTDGVRVELDDLDHLDQLVELLGDLLERRRPRR